MSKKIIILVSIISLVIIGFLINCYPVQRSMADKAVQQYMDKQGISKDNIVGKNIMKDYKQGGYEIDIVLKDDPGLVYSYFWRKENGVVLLVFINGTAGIDEGMKYPPLENH
ncbi:DUF3139 domain-containing protein [Bacillus marasmi]|uniref:DUF3139 domain-containing protein n=1 Tax=Bacillus marasmi TaxID=1926279 RepID=UPI0011CA0EFF|nr:DUF3139 domain-containing protein [Bacillus marasmi]